jgi:hypothetical protein
MEAVAPSQSLSAKAVLTHSKIPLWIRSGDTVSTSLLLLESLLLIANTKTSTSSMDEGCDVALTGMPSFENSTVIISAVKNINASTLDHFFNIILSLLNFFTDL